VPRSRKSRSKNVGAAFRPQVFPRPLAGRGRCSTERGLSQWRIGCHALLCSALLCERQQAKARAKSVCEEQRLDRRVSERVWAILSGNQPLRSFRETVMSWLVISQQDVRRRRQPQRGMNQKSRSCSRASIIACFRGSDTIALLDILVLNPSLAAELNRWGRLCSLTTHSFGLIGAAPCSKPDADVCNSLHVRSAMTPDWLPDADASAHRLRPSQTDLADYWRKQLTLCCLLSSFPVFGFIILQRSNWLISWFRGCYPRYLNITE
jgi:hypothetical protein